MQERSEETRRRKSQLLVSSVPGLSAEIAQCRLSRVRLQIEKSEKIPPTNISTMVKFITRYMARVRRLCFFVKRMIDRRFTVTIAADAVS